MKKSLLFLTLISLNSFADFSSRGIQPLVDVGFTQNACVVPLEAFSFHFIPTRDLRPTQVIATETRPNKPEMNYVTSLPLALLFDEYLPKAFAQCGLTQVNNPTEVTLQVEILEFEVTSNKKLLNSQSKAQTRVLLRLVNQKHQSQKEIVATYFLDTKSTSFGNIKKIEKVAGQIFMGVVLDLMRHPDLNLP